MGSKSRYLLGVALCLAATLCLLGAFSGGAVADHGDIYVNASENATANYDTVSAAIDNASSGDTIVVANGTYTEQVVVDKSVTLVAADEGGATIEYAPSSADGSPTVGIPSDGATVSGFVIERVAATRDSNAPFAQGVRISGSDVTVSNNTVVGQDFSSKGYLNNKGVMVLDDESGGSGENVSTVALTGNSVEGFAGPVSLAAYYGGNVSGVTLAENDLAGYHTTGITVGEIDGEVSSDLGTYEVEVTSDALGDATVYFESVDVALAYAAGQSGSVVEAEDGTYHVTDGMAISDALGEAETGATVRVRSGDYAETLRISTADLSLVAADGATLVPTEGDIGSRGRVVDVEADRVTVEGLTVDGSNTGAENPSGIYTSGANTTVEDTTVSHLLTAIQTSQAGSDGAYIANNTVRNVTVGISLQSNESTVLNNTVRDASLEGFGVIAGGSDGFANRSGHVLVHNDVRTVGDAPGIRFYFGQPTAVNDVSGPTPAVVTAILQQNAAVETVNVSTAESTYDRSIRRSGVYYPTVQTAVEGAGTGETVRLAPGTYDPAGRISVPADGVSIVGDTDQGVHLNTSDVAWGVYVSNKSNVTLRNLTIEGYEGDSTADDTVKVAFAENVVVENVEVRGSAGNEFDFNNVRNLGLHDVVADGQNTAGVGIAFTGVQNATLHEVRTSGNDWGGVGLYDAADGLNTPTGWQLQKNTSNVRITADSNLTESVPLYSDQEYGGTLGDLYAPAYDYAVENPDFRTRGSDFVFFKRTEGGAVTLALGLAENRSSTVRELSRDGRGEISLSSTFVVDSAGNTSMSIQAAVDAAPAGGTVEVRPGTYDGGITLSNPVTIAGAGMDQTVVDAANSTTAGNTKAFVVRSNDTTVRDLTMTDGHNTLRVSTSAHVENFSLVNTRVNDSSIGIYVAGNAKDAENGEFDRVRFENTHWVNNERKAIYAEKLSNATFDGLYIDGITSDTYGFNNGIDINLKGGNYSDVTIRDSVIANVSKGSPYDGVDSFSTAVAIKGRDDSSYSTNPGYLRGLSLENVTVRDSYNGLRLGEPGKNLTTPENVTITDSTFSNNTGYHLRDVTSSPVDVPDLFARGNRVDGGSVVVENRQTAGTTIWSTPATGIDEADSGDGVVLLPGTYNTSLQVGTGNLTIVSAGYANNTVIDADGASTALSVTAPNVTVVDVTLRGHDNRAIAAASDFTLRHGRVVSDGTQGIYTKGDISVEDSEFVDRGGSASTYAVRGDGADGISVTNSTFAGHQHGVLLANTRNATIAGNTFEALSTDGVLLSARNGGTTENVTVVRNTFRDTPNGIILVADQRNTPGTVGAVDVQRNRFDGESFGVLTLHQTSSGYTSANLTGPVDATRNYWGAPTGPSGVGPGTGANVSENVSFVPFYTNASLTTLSTEPPGVSGVRLTDLTDSNGVVADGESIRVRARVVDPSGIDAVTVDARPFGGPASLELTPTNAADEYAAEFTVDAAEANVDGQWALSVQATDAGGSTASASTGALTLSTDSTTRTTFSVSETRPFTTEVVTVDAAVENVGNRSADRTVTLLVDGSSVASRTVTVPANRSRTVSFDRKFDRGTHNVTVNDSTATLAPEPVTAVEPTNPDADLSITAPSDGATAGTGALTVEYSLSNVDTGIQAVAYAVDGQRQETVTDLSRSNVTVSGLADGQREVTLSLVDNLGDTVASETVTVDVDSTPPRVSLTAGRSADISAARPVTLDLAAQESNLASATLSVVDTSTDTVVYTADVRDELIDGNEAVTWGAVDDAGSPVATGEYAVELNATDEAGQSNETRTTVAVDATDPAVTDVGLTTTRLGSGDTLTVSATATDDNATVTDDASRVENVSVVLEASDVNFRTTVPTTLDDGTWNATVDVAALPVDGNYTVSARAVDSAGNDGTGSATDELAVDTTAPTVSAVVDTKNDSAGYVNVTVSESVSGQPTIDLVDPDGDAVSVDGFSEVGETDTYSGTFAIETNGEYELSANATDAAGNEGNSTASANVSVLPDRERHTIEGGDGTVVVLNMTRSQGGTAAFTTSATPLASLGSNFAETFLNGELNESLTENLDNATIRIPVDGNVPGSVDQSAVAISRYNATNNTWVAQETDVRTIDGTDYFVTTVEHFSTYGPVAPDTTAPTVDATSVDPSDPSYGTDTVDVQVTYSDNKQVDESNVTVRFDGEDVTDSADTSISGSQTTYTATDLTGSGQHWVNVTVVDTAGNTETANVSFTVPTDDDGPTVTSDFATSYPYGTETVTVDFAFDDALSGVDASTVDLEVDGKSVADADAVITADGVQYDATGLSAGSHTATVTVEDEAGNPTTVTETFTVSADTTAPTVTATGVSPAPTDGTLPAGTSTATFTVEYTDALSGVDTGAVTVSFDGTDVTDEAVVTADDVSYTALGLPNGSTHTLSVTVVDEAGQPTTETVTVEVDSPEEASGPTFGQADTGGASAPPETTRVSRLLVDGVATLDVEGASPVSSLRVTFGTQTSMASVSVQPLSERPDAVPAVPDSALLALQDVSVPSDLEDESATVRLTLDAVPTDTDPSSLSVYRYHDGEWQQLPTDVVSSGDSVVLEAETPGFSLFAVAASQASTSTETSTTDEPTTSDAPAGTTTAAEPSTTDDSTGFRIPGFGVPVAVLALTLAALAAARRNRA